MKKAAVLGCGATGKSVITYLLQQNYSIQGFDQGFDQLKKNPFFEKILLTTDQSDLDSKIDFIVKSPGIDPLHNLLQQAKEQKVPILTEFDLAYQKLNKSKAKFIGITGSLGKTTTTKALEHVLKCQNIQAYGCGNLGDPLLNQDGTLEIYLIEMSSFQLENLKIPFLDAAVILNLYPNHLDYHKTFAAYTQAKLQIADCLKNNAPLWTGSSVPIKSFTFETGVSKVQKAMPNIYVHDQINYAAVLAVCDFLCIEQKVVFKALETFQKPAHRLEFVKHTGGVSFINDSKATTPDAVIEAIKSIKGQILLIAGGKDKQLSYHLWKKLFLEKVKVVYLLGETQKQIALDLQGVFTVQVDSLKEAVQLAFKQAKKGDTVLLSPGCSSQDMFKSYINRGKLFKQYVKQLDEVIQ